MKKFLSVFLCIALIAIGFSSAPAENVNALLLLAQNYGANYFLDLDNFEQFGWDITRAGVAQVIQPCPSYAGNYGARPITVDILVSDIEDISEYDVLAIMPSTMYAGNPFNDLLNSPEALSLISSAVDAGLVVYAHCAGPRVLAAADVLDGIEMTGKSQFQAEYEAAGATFLGEGIPPVIDGNIVTSTRGMYFHVQICEAIATALEDGSGGLAEGDEK